MKEQDSDKDFHETIINLIVKFSVIEKMLIDKGIFSKEDYLKELELTFINKKIVYRDPFVGNHIRLTSRASQILLYRLKYEMPQVDNIRKIQQRLDRYIEKRQNELLICYFN